MSEANYLALQIDTIDLKLNNLYVALTNLEKSIETLRAMVIGPEPKGVLNLSKDEDDDSWDDQDPTKELYYVFKYNTEPVGNYERGTVLYLYYEDNGADEGWGLDLSEAKKFTKADAVGFVHPKRKSIPSNFPWRFNCAADDVDIEQMVAEKLDNPCPPARKSKRKELRLGVYHIVQRRGKTDFYWDGVAHWTKSKKIAARYQRKAGQYCMEGLNNKDANPKRFPITLRKVEK